MCSGSRLSEATPKTTPRFALRAPAPATKATDTRDPPPSRLTAFDIAVSTSTSGGNSKSSNNSNNGESLNLVLERMPSKAAAPSASRNVIDKNKQQDSRSATTTNVTLNATTTNATTATQPRNHPVGAGKDLGRFKLNLSTSSDSSALNKKRTLTQFQAGRFSLSAKPALLQSTRSLKAPPQVIGAKPQAVGTKSQGIDAKSHGLGTKKLATLQTRLDSSKSGGGEGALLRLSTTSTNRSTGAPLSAKAPESRPHVIPCSRAARSSSMRELESLLASAPPLKKKKLRVDDAVETQPIVCIDPRMRCECMAVLTMHAAAPHAVVCRRVQRLTLASWWC